MEINSDLAIKVSLFFVYLCVKFPISPVRKEETSGELISIYFCVILTSQLTSMMHQARQWHSLSVSVKASEVPRHRGKKLN